MITDPIFYLCAVPAVLCFGMAKGGLGSALSLTAVPLMALAVPPLTAAAILLPILLVMDVVAVRSFWREWDSMNLKLTLPGALLGIVVGTFTFSYLNDDAIRLLLGIIVVIFIADFLFQSNKPAKAVSLRRGSWWGAVSGFTSFGIHAGGPPISIFILPQRLPKRQLMGTFAVFFAVVNVIKLIPYGALGQLSWSNMMTSFVLMPIAPIGVLLGVYLLDKISEKSIYSFTYFGLGLLGVKLCYDGITGLFF
ncbi:MAG: sulfite exporter TauE/SafE family protein [Pseudomonadota bacterium]